MLLFALGLLGLTTTSVTLARSKNKKEITSFVVIEDDDGKEHTIRLNS
jgi:hypothetical protein